MHRVSLSTHDVKLAIHVQFFEVILQFTCMKVKL